MDVSFPPKPYKIYTVAVSLILFFQLSNSAFGYDEYTHEWITRNALTYLKTHRHVYPETDAWVQGLGTNEGFMEETLVRAVVDTDYKTDMWLNAWFHKPFVGGQSGKLADIFTTMFHFLNVTVAGDHWTYDGYAYRHSTKQGNDTYLNDPSVTVWGSYSHPLGGLFAPGHNVIHGYELDAYRDGFRGNTADWNKMFFYDNDASKAVFPPSNVPAQMAFNKMLTTPRATSNMTDSWNEDLPLISGLFSTNHTNRHYWRGEIEGMPKGLDLLGMTMHLTQDATVPHHVEGTSDNCHPEYESMVDQLACGTSGALNYAQYYDGSYDGAVQARCDALYDPALVAQVFNDHRSIDALLDTSVHDRMQQIAFITSRWNWKNHGSTELPDGRIYVQKDCGRMLSIQAVRQQAKYQYNMAIAATIVLFEIAAHQYEALHEPAAPIITRLFEILSTPVKLF